jgi:hypothetical protein
VLDKLGGFNDGKGDGYDAYAGLEAFGDEKEDVNEKFGESAGASSWLGTDAQMRMTLLIGN